MIDVGFYAAVAFLAGCLVQRQREHEAAVQRAFRGHTDEVQKWAERTIRDIERALKGGRV